MRLLKTKPFNNWEFWPSYMFYIPILPYAIYLAIKARNLVFYSATNPSINHSGNGSESKFKTLNLIPNEFIPISIFIKKKEDLNWVLNEISIKKLTFPLIIKPDIGFRGLLVKQLHSKKDLQNYLLKYNCIDLILQEFIDFKNECGIFYYRIPNEKNGAISSITLKKFLTVIGDGSSNLEKLIKEDKRAFHYYDFLKELHHKDFKNIPNKNTNIQLNVIGNHSKGTQFINGNHLISKDLNKIIDQFMKQIPDFYYGRLDLKFNSFENLIKKNEFKVLEINGIISEPTHIYDSTSINYFNALKSLKLHWGIIYKIAVNNNKNGVKYDTVPVFLKSLIDLKKYTKIIKKLV
ncbi:ATP-grasp domain-containing protein [Lutibacter citreus]|uniref:D-alanine--D-alanine ligase n=1 Tax=Lutibacter citreus TaxID=2138210 RepID=UPI000DBE5468|nr:D-alanine--D-alanine ligase [Lutibacter citreus]